MSDASDFLDEVIDRARDFDMEVAVEGVAEMWGGSVSFEELVHPKHRISFYDLSVVEFDYSTREALVFAIERSERI